MKNQHRLSIMGRVVVVLGGMVILAWQGGHADNDASPGTIQLASYRVPTTMPFQPAPTHPMTIAAPRETLQKPLIKQVNLSIRVRLFADQALRFVSLEGDNGLLLKSKKINGTVAVSIQDGQVMARQGRHVLALTPTLLINSYKGGAIDIHRPRLAGRHTLGELRISVKKGHLHIVNTLDLEAYLMGIVEPELGSLKLPPEVLKAQLIASRSYILASRDRHPKEGFDFCDSPHCQVFRGAAHYPAKYLQAAAACRGLYLTYHGRPATAFFHHSCGGSTAAIEDVWPSRPIAYLRRVNDGAGESFCGSGQRAVWSFTADRGSLRKCLARSGWVPNGEALDSLQVMRVDASGRARQILVQSSQPHWVRADTFRHALNQYYGREVLLSALFTISRQGNSFRFDGKGWGHGVGMCQSGAIHMARRGKTCQQILAHYYPGTEIAQLKTKAE